MKDIVAMIALPLALFAVAPAKAGPMEDCTTVRKSHEQAFNDRNWDKLMTMFTRDVHFFSSAVNEVMIGTDTLRTFYATSPGDAKLRMGEHSAVHVAPNVLLCTGYQVLMTAKNESVIRGTLVLVNNNGNWLAAQVHYSRLPK